MAKTPKPVNAPQNSVAIANAHMAHAMTVMANNATAVANSAISAASSATTAQAYATNAATSSGWAATNANPSISVFNQELYAVLALLGNALNMITYQGTYNTSHLKEWCEENCASMPIIRHFQHCHILVFGDDADREIFRVGFFDEIIQ